MNKETILITGIAGLLGSRLADYYRKNHPNVTIVGIDNLSGGFEKMYIKILSFMKLILQKKIYKESSLLINQTMSFILLLMLQKVYHLL